MITGSMTFSPSRGIIYTTPPAADRPRDETADQTRNETAENATIEDTPVGRNEAVDEHADATTRAPADD